MRSAYGKSAPVLILTSVLLTSIAQLLFRYAMKQGSAPPDGGLSLVASIATAFATVDVLLLFLGVLLYGVSMVVWIIALTRYPVSFAYPMLSISYILVYVAATQLSALNESASLAHSVGVGIIVVGVWLVSKDGRIERQT